MKSPDFKTIYIDQWKGGMDTRAGLFADALKTFRELTNCIISVNGNVVTRPPVRAYGVTIDSDCQGWLYNNGVWNTFAQKGANVTHTGANASTVVTNYWDTPNYCTSTWTLLAHFVFRGNVVAVIRHGYQGLTVTSRVFYHVWDAKSGQPTYVFDPYAPQSWSLGTWPIWIYNSAASKPGNFQDFTPALTLGGEKIISGRADGAAAYSAIGRGRVWNTRTADDIERTGAMYYFVMPNLASAQFDVAEYSFVESVYTDFAGYTVEKLDAAGTWTKLTQTTGSPSVGFFRIDGHGGTAGLWPNNQMYITIAELPDTIVRLRMCVTPEVRIVSGGVYNPGNLSITGDGAIVDFNMGVPYAGFASTYIGKIGGVNVTGYYDVVNSTSTALVQLKRFSTTINTGTGAGDGNAGTRVNTAGVVFGGSGYNTGDTVDVTLTGGGPGGTKVRLSVTAAAGVVMGVAISNPNQAHLLRPTGTTGTTTVTGGGSGLTVSLTWLTTVAAVNVALPYAAVIDTTNITTVINLVNVAFTTYTSASGTPSAAFTWVIWNTPAADNGKLLSGNIILKNTIAITFDATNTLVSGGQVTYEGTTYDYTAGQKSLLNGTDLYIGIQVSGGTASVITQPIATPFYEKRYNTYILGQVSSSGAYTPFVYSYIANNAWYAARHLENLSYWAGSGEAGFINTSTRNRYGGNITSLISVKNRLLIAYAQSTQLWQFDPDPNNNSFIDRYDFGTTGPMALFYDQVMLKTQRAPRLFELTGFNYQALVDTNVGEPLTDIGAVEFSSASFWPWFGGFVAFGTLTDSSVYADRAHLPNDSVLRATGTNPGIYILSFSKESQTAAWSWNPIPGLTTSKWQVMTPLDSQMFFVGDGNVVYYLDGKAETNFVDAPQSGVVASRGITHFSHLENPGVEKQFVSLDVAGVSEGMQISAHHVPSLNPGKTTWGPVLVDTTFGNPRIPFGASGVAVAVDIQCNNIDGMEIQALDIKYRLKGRR